MVIFQKLMASSIRALRVSLDRRRQRLEHRAATPSLTKKTKAMIAEFEDRLDAGRVRQRRCSMSSRRRTPSEATELKRLVALLDAVPRDSKAETLVAQLQELSSIDPAAKVLCSPSSARPRSTCVSGFEAIGWDVQLFHGQLKPEAKDASVDAFRSSDGTKHPAEH